MACQTGIRPDKELKNFFEECKRGKVRLAKFVINKERINVNFHAPYSEKKAWTDDWKANLPGCVDSYEPCFLLFRLDTIHDWALISFADDKAPTRDKMLLAATKATFKSEFGVSFIKHDIQASNPSDLEVEKIKRKVEGAKITDAHSQPATQLDLPYTHIERELSTVSKDKINIPQPKQPTQMMRGILFPIDQDAIELLKSFAQGHMDFVQLSVDTLNEAIKLESHKNQLSADHLSKEISKQKPRYTLFRFREADGEPVFFIYSVPQSVTCTIKEKMLFSSCKAPFIGEIQKECGVKISKKIEVDSRDRMDGPTLLSYINPMLVPQEPKKFDRPARPGRPRTTVPT